MSLVAQWIGALGSAIGAAATCIAVVVAYRGLRGELRRANDDRALAHRERTDREAAQARLVLVRVDVALPPGPDPAIITGTHRHGDIAVLLDNQSDEPVLDARVEQLLLQTLVGPTVFDYAEPAQQWRLNPDWNPGQDPVPGGSGRDWHIVVSTGSDQQRHHIDPNDRFIATVVFTDATGLRWRRTGTDQPVRVLLTTASGGPEPGEPGGPAPGASASWYPWTPRSRRR